MKRMFVLGAVLLGAATMAHAGVRLNIGVGIPLGGAVISAPPVYQAPPPVVYQAPAPVPPPVVYQAPPPVVYTPPPVVYAPAPVVCAPAPSIYFGFGTGGWGHRYYGHGGWGHRGWHR